MDGILVIDKPAGPTSHDVVSRLRYALKEKKVGHTGTLDPTATGVLPIVLGVATKVARYISCGDKTYRATIRLGITTDTLDAAGVVQSEQPVTVDEVQVRKVLESFIGEIEQVPPMYSAKKVDGKKLYELARKGIEVERKAKKVHIHRLEIISVALPELTIEVSCSAGTYVRVLARDVGERLGCGGHLELLTRISAGQFLLSEAITLQEAIDDPNVVKQKIIPISKALTVLPKLILPKHVAKMVQDGFQLTVAQLRTLDTPNFSSDETIGLWLDSGEIIAIAKTLMPANELAVSRRDRQALKTERVLLQKR
ncbi:MAG: tRNA pseudouridine(55) synthase TruB [Deltaproteobacteria bacterium]|nr:tRNA pseudouridine(55) synthase TruB [Deltaproteobacteria bacterium]